MAMAAELAVREVSLSATTGAGRAAWIRFLEGFLAWPGVRRWCEAFTLAFTWGGESRGWEEEKEEENVEETLRGEKSFQIERISFPLTSAAFSCFSPKTKIALAFFFLRRAFFTLVG